MPSSDEEIPTPDLGLPTSAPDEVPTTNPLATHFSFDLSLPKIQVRMVDAAVLEEYELWFTAASVLISAAIGFLVAYLQSFNKVIQIGAEVVARQSGDSVYLVVSILFWILFGLAATRAVFLRRRIQQKSTTYAMQAVGQDPME